MFFSILLLAMLGALHSPSADAKCAKYVDAAKTAGDTLQSKYFSNGIYKDDQAVWIGAVDTFYLLKLDQLTGTSDNAGVIDTVFNGQEDYLDNGESFDDVQWVSIAYLTAGNTAKAKHYYDIASTAMDSDYCDGGLFWSGDRDYKNAITNELYMTTSGYLYEVTQDEKYMTNLKNTWSWLKASQMKGSNGLFNDGLTKDGKCANNGQTQWTYNQGTLLPGLAYLYKNGDEQALNDAYKIIDALITNQSNDGGLRESCEDSKQNLCNADQQTFKGITVYFISWFLSISGQDNGTKYSDFIKAQADKILENAAIDGRDGEYGSVWYAKAASNDDGGAQSQASALGALVAAGQQSC